MNQILFGVIAVLMFAITGIGFAEVRIQMADTGTPAAIESPVAAAPQEPAPDIIATDPDSASAALTDAAESVVSAYAGVFRSREAELEDESEDADEEHEDEEEEDDDRESDTRASQAASATPSPAKPSASATFTMADVAAHASTASCYTVVGGSVYDVTPFVARHPGGQAAIKSMCGVDGTTAFSSQHGGQGKPETTLAAYKIGTLR